MRAALGSVDELNMKNSVCNKQDSLLKSVVEDSGFTLVFDNQTPTFNLSLAKQSLVKKILVRLQAPRR